jgi:hypothetical protein
MVFEGDEWECANRIILILYFCFHALFFPHSPQRLVMTTYSPYTSLLDVARHRQGAGFVGRNQYVGRFRQNLAKDYDDPDRRFVFVISGDSGVGKTWLMYQLQRVAELESGALALWDSGDAEDPVAVMVHLSEQLARHGIAMPQFAGAYKKYAEGVRLLADNLDRASGVRFLITDSLIDSPVQWQERKSGWGLVPATDLDTLYTSQLHSREELARQLLPDEDSYRLVTDPVSTLSPLWLADIRSVTRTDTLALFFDDIHRAGGWLESWLFSILTGAYGQVPLQTTWVMSWLQTIDMDRWRPLADIMAHFALKPLPREDAGAFLHRYNGYKPDDELEQVDETLPVALVARAAYRKTLQRDPVDDAGVSVMRQLFDAVSVRQRRALVLAALPDVVTRARMATLMDTSQDDPAITWLFDLPLLQPLASGPRMPGALRRELLAIGRQTMPDTIDRGLDGLAAEFRHLSDLLKLAGPAMWAELAWRELWLTHLRYRLLQDPGTYLGMALDAVLSTLELNPDWARALARTLISAGEEGAGEQVADWGRRIFVGAEAFA